MESCNRLGNHLPICVKMEVILLLIQYLFLRTVGNHPEFWLHHLPLGSRHSGSFISSATRWSGDAVKEPAGELGGLPAGSCCEIYITPFQTLHSTKWCDLFLTWRSTTSQSFCFHSSVCKCLHFIFRWTQYQNWMYKIEVCNTINTQKHILQ